MKSLVVSSCFAMLIAQSVVGEFLPQAGRNKETAAVQSISFADAKYFHRFTTNDQHEYTPAGQENLNAWTDMVTLLLYRKVKDGEALAATANAVLENYKANKAAVLRTDSIPRTREKPAEHLIVVIFGGAEFMEAAFARFRMHAGAGSAVIYSHRIYGNKVADEMGAWLKTNGPALEKNLMKWDAMPMTFPN